MGDLKSYISNESLVNLEDLIELGNAYKAIAKISKTMKTPLGDDVLYSIDCITREINKRTKQ